MAYGLDSGLNGPGFKTWLASLWQDTKYSDRSIWVLVLLLVQPDRMLRSNL